MYNQNTLLPPARISFNASVQNGVALARSVPTCSTYSCQLLSISSLKTCARVPSRRPCCRFSGWYTTKSEMGGRAKRRAFCFGSCTMNGLTGRSGPVMRCPGGRAPPVAAGAGGAGDAGDGGEAGGAGGAAGATRGAAEAAGSGRAANGAGAGGGRNTGAAGGAGRGGGAARAGGAAGAGGAGGAGGGGGAGRGATNGPDRRGGAGGAGGGGAGVGGLSAGGTCRAGGVAVALAAPTAKTVLQTLQRARTPAAGTLAGSTRYTVSHDGQVTFTPTAPLALSRVVVQLRVVPAVDHQHRPRLRLGVSLHLGRQLAHLRRVREVAVLIRDDTDRQRHQRHPVQLAAAVLPKVVPSAPVLFVVRGRDDG